MFLLQRNRLCLLLLIITLVGCEDVIEVELADEAPRLIIDALIRVNMSEPSTPVAIRVSLTDGFFGTVPLTKLDNIIIIMEELEDELIRSTVAIPFEEIENNFGIYNTVNPISNSLLKDNNRFSLYIEHAGHVYLAQTFFSPAPPIKTVAQSTSEIFNPNDTEITITFEDIPEKDNYYVFDFDNENYSTLADEFFAGQEYTFSYSYNSELPRGTQLEIGILGADMSFYNYMDLLLEQSEGEFELFETPVASVRGNFVDVTNIDNIDSFDNVERPNVFALGYFGIVQEHKMSLKIE